LTPRRRVRVQGDDQDRHFSGMVITPYGPLDLDFDQANELSKLLPEPDLVRFVGIDEELFSRYLQGQPLLPRQEGSIGDLSLVGKDGLLIAPVSRIRDGGIQSGMA